MVTSLEDAPIAPAPQARPLATIEPGMTQAAVMKLLLEAGVHFGHQTKRWNPKMRPYIFTERNGIHIIDLAQTVTGLETACAYVEELAAQGGRLLFVGTKKQAQDVIAEESKRCNQFYVNKRWPGGLLTNFVTIKTRLKYLGELEAQKARGEFEMRTKKEASKLNEEIRKLSEVLGGIKTMGDVPSAMFVIDPFKEHIGMAEAVRLKIPVLAIGDTNANPDDIDFVIPGNDDAIRAIKIISARIADAYIAGAQRREAMRADMMMSGEEMGGQQREPRRDRGGDRDRDQNRNSGGGRGGRGGNAGGANRERNDRPERRDNASARPAPAQAAPVQPVVSKVEESAPAPTAENKENVEG